MKTMYEAVRPLEPGKPVAVVERNELGALVGAYLGYWNFKRGTVALYPDYKNRFVNWPDGKVPSKRIVISDSLIRCRKQNIDCKNKSTPVDDNKGEGWRERKSPLKGQERMDI